MLNNGLFTSSFAEWSTPRDEDEIEKVFAEYNPAIDICAWDWTAKLPVWITPFEDALSLNWRDVCIAAEADSFAVFSNPPYGRELPVWIAKYAKEQKNGITTIALIPARTDTSYWHKYIWDKEAERPRKNVRVRFLSGRYKFGEVRPDLESFDPRFSPFIDSDFLKEGASRKMTSAPFPSAIVIFEAEGQASK